MRSDRGSASRLLRPVRTLLQRQSELKGGRGPEQHPLLVDHEDHLVETVLDANRISRHAFRHSETDASQARQGDNE